MNKEILINKLETNDIIQKDKEYWLNRINGNWTFGLYRPSIHKKRSRNTYKTLTTEINIEINDRLMKKNNQSLYGVFAFCLAAVSIVTYKLNGDNDMLIASPIFKQKNKRLYSNELLPLRLEINPSIQCSELIQKIWKEISKNNKHITYPVEHMLKNRKVIEGTESPLFGLLVEMPEIHQFIQHNEKASLIYCQFQNNNNSPVLNTFYHEDFYFEEDIMCFNKYVINVLNEISNYPHTVISDIHILDENEKAKLLEFSRPYQKQLPKWILLDYLKRVTMQFPDKNAVESGDDCLTFYELNEKSDQLASVLVKKGIQDRSIVGISIKRSVNWLVSVLAVMKIRGICLPIDLANSHDYNINLIRDSNAEYLIVSAETEDFSDSGTKVVNLSEIEDSDCFYDLDYTMDDNSPLYMIYTSGSTGRSKGMVLNHNGIINHLLAKVDDLGLKETDILMHCMNMSFVASIWQLFMPIVTGGKLVICKEEEIIDTWGLFKSVNENKVTAMAMVPAILNSYLVITRLKHSLVSLDNMRCIDITGERVLPSLVNDFFRTYKHITLFNTYGQSECSDDTFHYRIPYNENTQIVPIGKPILNMKGFVLDENLNLVPIGVPGELYISGVGVVDGYYDNIELSKQHFLAHFSIPGEIMYKLEIWYVGCRMEI